MDLLFSTVAGIGMTVFIIGVCTIIEQISIIERYPLRARLPGLAMNAAQGPLTFLFAWPLSKVWESLSIGKFVTVPLSSWLGPLGAVGYALQILVMLMLADFLIYWRHRVEHKIFWPIHAVHHSPTELHAANDIGHPMQVWFNLVLVVFPLSLVQIDGPATPAAVSFVMTLLTYYIHSPIDVHFGPLRKLLVDNRFHRIHHSLEPRHFDKNFAICFSIWDRWFGTAYDPAPDEWPQVGLADIAPPRTIREYVCIPFGYRTRNDRDPKLVGSPNSIALDQCMTNRTFAPSSTGS